MWLTDEVTTRRACLPWVSLTCRRSFPMESESRIGGRNASRQVWYLTYLPFTYNTVMAGVKSLSHSHLHFARYRRRGKAHCALPAPLDVHSSQAGTYLSGTLHCSIAANASLGSASRRYQMWGQQQQQQHAARTDSIIIVDAHARLRFLGARRTKRRHLAQTSALLNEQHKVGYSIYRTTIGMRTRTLAT